jgi:hypothetical protein
MIDNLSKLNFYGIGYFNEFPLNNFVQCFCCDVVFIVISFQRVVRVKLYKLNIKDKSGKIVFHVENPCII